MSKPVVAIVGSAMMDLTVFTDVIPTPGQTVIGKTFTSGFGGKGANQAVMAARCGVEVVFFGAIGRDTFGEAIIQNFSSVGIDCSFIETSVNSTSVAHITVDSKAENRIVIVPSADKDLQPLGVHKSILSVKKLSAVVAQNEINQEITKQAFIAGKNVGCLTFLNPAPYTEIPTETLALTDWLIPNENEFCLMEGIDAVDEEYLKTYNAPYHLIITLGERGALLKRVSEKPILFSAPTVSAVDTTGAGDAFVGSFVALLLTGLEPEKAITLAIRVASSSVTKVGAQSSYPNEAELMELRMSS